MKIRDNAQFANDYLDVRTRSGVEWLALCPYHKDQNPSFSFNVHKGLFICYACGAKGNTEQLAKHFGVVASGLGAKDISADDVKQKIRSVYENRDEIVEDNPRADSTLIFSRLGDEYKSRWANRGITSQQVLDDFQLGYSPVRDALTIPLFGDSGTVEEFVYRNLVWEPGRPKYLYPTNYKISSHLYGYWQATCLSMGRRIKALAITEGSIDTLAMWEVGIPSVALLGASFTAGKVNKLRKLDPKILVVMTDMDTAGARASLEIESALSNSGIIVVRAVWESDTKDPAELSPERRLEIFSRSLDMN